MSRANRPPIREHSVSEPGADDEHCPALDIRHERQLAQSLNHSVVVQHDRDRFLADRGDAVPQAIGERKAAALPVAGQILAALLDRAVAADNSRAAGADEGSELQLFLLGVLDQGFERRDQPLHGFLATRLVVGMAPQLRFQHFRFGRFSVLLLWKSYDSGSDVGPADVHCQEAVMAGQYPARNEMRASLE